MTALAITGMGLTGVLRLTFQRQHLVWINRGSGGILVFAGVMLRGSLVVEHWV